VKLELGMARERELLVRYGNKVESINELEEIKKKINK
jgi:hypothetical protein